VAVAELGLSKLLQSSRQDLKTSHNSSGDKLQLSQTVHFVASERYRKLRASGGTLSDPEAFSVGKVSISVSVGSPVRFPVPAESRKWHRAGAHSIQITSFIVFLFPQLWPNAENFFSSWSAVGRRELVCRFEFWLRSRSR
jgi:hypothetical protein